MALRIPNFLVFLFALQAILTFQLTDVDRHVALVHLAALFTTLVYFAITVFAIPRLRQYTTIKFDSLFSQSLLPFLQVTAADMWLMATSMHVWNPVAAVGLAMTIACLFLL
jgi:hypothetical protein